jgi:hypothetical protein
MADITKRRTDRDRVLHALYDATDTGGITAMMPSDIAQQTGLTGDDVDAAVRWLVDRSYAGLGGLSGEVHITAQGVDRAEVTAEPVAEAQPLALTVAERQLLEVFVRDARMAIEASALVGDELADAEAQLATIEAQARSPRPRRDIVGAAIRALTWVGKEALSGVIGGGTYAGLMPLAG